MSFIDKIKSIFAGGDAESNATQETQIENAEVNTTDEEAKQTVDMSNVEPITADTAVQESTETASDSTDEVKKETA